MNADTEIKNTPIKTSMSLGCDNNQKIPFIERNSKHIHIGEVNNNSFFMSF